MSSVRVLSERPPSIGHFRTRRTVHRIIEVLVRSLAIRVSRTGALAGSPVVPNGVRQSANSNAGNHSVGGSWRGVRRRTGSIARIVEEIICVQVACWISVAVCRFDALAGGVIRRRRCDICRSGHEALLLC